MARRQPHQPLLTFSFKGRGGARSGAGRPRKSGAEVLHRARESVPAHCPVHVTLKVKRDIPRLRLGRFVRAFRQLLSACCTRRGFRVVHYSIQKDHIHLIIEAKDKHLMACGMKSLGARIAKAINRVFDRRGPALRGRFHSHVLRTPREVRNALAYVLLNIRHHLVATSRKLPAPQIDEASSATWFDGWKDFMADPPAWPKEVAAAETWLLNVGWRRHRLIGLEEVPG